MSPTLSRFSVAMLALVAGRIGSGCGGSVDITPPETGATGGSTGADASAGQSGTGLTGGTGASAGHGGTDARTGGTGGIAEQGGAGGTGGTGAAAPSGGMGAGGAGGTGETGCTAISVSSWTNMPTSPKNYLGADIASNIGGPLRDAVALDFFAPAGSDAGGLPTGTFDFSAGDDSNRSPCEHCLLIGQDINDSTQRVGKYYYPQSGTLQLTQADNPFDGRFRGSLVDVVAVEVTIDWKTYVSTPVPGGACVKFSADFDLTKSTQCELASDCGETDTYVCDPKTGTCAVWGCNNDYPYQPYQPCASASDECLNQDLGVTDGACYAKCTPFGSTHCNADFSCIPSSVGGATGVCYRTGTAAANGPCSGKSDVSTRSNSPSVIVPIPAGVIFLAKSFPGTPSCSSKTSPPFPSVPGLIGAAKYFQSRVGWQSIHPETCVARYFPLAMRSGVRSTVIVEGGSTLEYFKKKNTMPAAARPIIARIL